MEQVKASIGQELFKIEITSPSGNVVIADEPIDKGGQNKGFAPKELLAASLAACTCATLRMYASHKAWDLHNVNVEITLTEEDGKTTLNRNLHLEGDLDEQQRARLLSVANACPVHKILTHTIEINTQLV